MRIRLNLSDAVQDLAPAAPLCFLNRPQWLEYLKSAAAAQCHCGEPKVIIIVNEEPVFNKEFDFCLDCESSEHREFMRMRGMCRPDWLTNEQNQSN